MIAGQMPTWSQVIAPHVDRLARMVANAGKGDVRPVTRLSP
jgi:hypothetical protein